MGESGDDEARPRTISKHKMATASVKKRWARSIPVKVPVCSVLLNLLKMF